MGGGTSARSATERKLITFATDAINYALKLECAREVHAWAGARPFPCTPPHVRGVIDLRGKIIPIVDLRARLSKGFTDAGDEHVVIIVIVNQDRFGILVDKIHGIVTVRSEEINAPPASYEFNPDNLFTGIVRDGDQIIGILDPRRILSLH
jgi:purine-binding chemotaxis protein CheW